MKPGITPFGKLSAFKTFIAIIACICLATDVGAYGTATVGAASSTSSLSGPTTSSSTGARIERHSAIYSVAELTAAGLTSGNTLMSIGWNKTDVGAYAGNDLAIKVYLKHNSAVTFAANPTYATDISTATLVYSTTTGTIPATIGWYTLNFNATTFTWNGTDNIQVITEIVRSTSWTSTSFSWTTLASITNTGATANGTTAPPTLTRTGTRPQVRFEIATPGDDAGITSIPNPLSGLPGVQNINIVLRNTGTTTLTTASLNWTLNGGSPTNYAWAGSLIPGASTGVTTLASTNFGLGPNVVQVSVVNANSLPDQYAGNDVLSKSVDICQPLSGAYTINDGAATAGTNFNSFSDFARLLTHCGISGNVVATVTPGSGPYTEQVIFSDISGLSAGNAITIQGSGATITSDTAIIQNNSNPNRYIFRLINMQYFTINNLHINMFPGSTGFIGIQGYLSGNHITVSNCVIDMGAGTSTLLGAVVFNGDDAGILTPGGTFDNISITGNTFSNGGYGVSVIGLAPPLATNVNISNNTITNFNSNGIYLRETDGTIVSYNNCEKTTSINSSCYAIQVAQANNINTSIFNNRIKLNQTLNTQGGIYLFNGTGHKVYNNVISASPAGGNSSGIILRGTGSGQLICFNTISMDDAASTTANLFGIRTESNGTLATIRNNAISLTQTAAFKSCFMLSTTTITNLFTACNNNLLWVPGGNMAGSGSTTTPVLYSAALGNWTTTTGFDLASVNIDPMFASSTLLKVTNPAANNLGVAISGITTDILGIIRGPLPDMGAYEFNVPLPIGLLSFSGRAQGSVNKLTWQTASEHGNKGFELQRSIDGREFITLAFIPSAAISGNSSQSLSYSYDDASPQDEGYYRLRQLDNNGEASLSNIVLIKRNKLDLLTINSIYPNPVTDEVNIIVTAAQEEQGTLTMTDMIGKKLVAQLFTLIAGENKLTVQTNNLPAGHYLLKLTDTKGNIITMQKMVKK